MNFCPHKFEHLEIHNPTESPQICTFYLQPCIFQCTHYLRQSRAARALRLPRENQARIDEVKQPTSTQASPPRRPPRACWDLYHVEDKMQLSWMLETGADGRWWRTEVEGNNSVRTTVEAEGDKRGDAQRWSEKWSEIQSSRGRADGYRKAHVLRGRIRFEHETATMCVERVHESSCEKKWQISTSEQSNGGYRGVWFKIISKSMG